MQKACLIPMPERQAFALPEKMIRSKGIQVIETLAETVEG